MELPATLVKKITYRPYAPGDDEAIMRLWKEESGWGEITADQFRQWFRETPNGETIIIVAEDEEKQVHGQVVFIPSHVLVNGRVLRSLRAAAPILDGTLRQSSIRSMDHPAFELLQKGLAVAKEKGYHLVYAFPAHGWIAMLRLLPQLLPFPTEAISLDCFAFALSDADTWPGYDNNFKVVEIKQFSAEHEALWDETVRDFPIGCALHRKAAWLQWITGSHLKLEIRSAADDRLVGYSCIKKDSGLLTDIVARNSSDLQNTYLSTIRALHHANPARIEVTFDKLKGMMTPEARASLHGVDYAQDSYQFAFSYILLDEDVDSEAVRTSRWYLTPLG